MEKLAGRPGKRPAEDDANTGPPKRPNQRNPAVMRSTNLRDVTLVIRPWSHFQQRHDQIPIHGVTFKQVKQAFTEVAASTAANPGARYVFQFPEYNNEGWVKLSTNPFYHYETWIHQVDLERCGRVDRELPNGHDKSVRKYITNIGTKLWPDYESTWGGLEDGANFTWENEYGVVPLSAARMKEAKTGKRTGSQDTIMNKTSATEVALGIGWTDGTNSDKPLSGNSIAEWLHISAYAYGGLTGDPNSASTSQMKLNFVLGTAETNSLMLRYETAWTRFFLMEQELREQELRAINDVRHVDVQGQLTFVNNVDQTIQNRTEVNGNHIVTPIAFGGNEWLKNCFAYCPWMSFALHYTVSMDGMSSVLDWNEPTFSIQFFPFARPFFTKEESMVDMLLLQRAYDAKLAALQPGPPMARALTSSAYSRIKPSDDARLGHERFSQMELHDVLELFPQHEPLTVDDMMFSGLPLRSSVETTGKELAPGVAAFLFTEQKASRTGARGDRVVLSASSCGDASSDSRNNSMLVGGAPVYNIAMIVGPEPDKYADLPVTVCSTFVSPTEEAILFASAKASTHANASPLEATLLMSCAPRPGVEVSDPLAAGTLQGVIMESFPELRATRVPDYILKGDIYTIFGIPGLNGQLYIFHGRDNRMPIKEKVKIDLHSFGNNPLAELFPYIGKDVARHIPISNFELVYSEEHSQLRQAPGLRLTADIEFKGPLQPVSELLSVLFEGTGNNVPDSLHVSAHLSQTRDWTVIPSFSSLTLQGSFQDMSFWVGDFLEINTIGVEVEFIQVTNLAGTDTVWSRGYGMHLTSSSWESAFGIQNLNITDVNFLAYFSSKSIKESLNFSVSACMMFGDTQLDLTGHYSKAETYLEASVANLSWSEIVKFYNQLTGASVDDQLERHDINFEHMYLKLSTKGVIIEGKVSFNGHTSVKGYLKLESGGISIGGGVDDFLIEGTGLELKSARIDIFVASKESIHASRFSILGNVLFSGITVRVAFMIEGKQRNSKSNNASEREWALFGQYEGNLRLKDMCSSPIEGGLGDLELRNITLIAASGANVTIGELNTLDYPVKKGISLCATISPMEELNKFSQQQIDGLILIATIQKKLEIQIQLPKAFDVEITPTVKLTDIGVGIEISTNPSLMVSAVLNILMESGEDPLLLEGRIKAGLLDASASVVTKSPWVNPFNISQQVTIADFKVLLGITYATLAEAGPSQMALVGALRVGKFKAGAGMSISHYPDQQLIKADISKVDLIEIIRVAGQVANIEVLKDMSGGEDTFVFTEAYLYISTGATIGDTEYPRGISAGGGLTAFGKSARFDLSISADGLDFQGFIDNFSLGPLVVASASGDPRASMVVRMTKKEQVIKIDGMVTCFGIGFAALVDIQMGSDNPSFKAYLAVQFTEAFKIDITAAVEDFHDVKDLAIKGLYFKGRIEGDLFEVICEGIIKMLKSIEELGTQGIESFQNLIGARIAERQGEMEQLAKEVREAQEKVASRRDNRQIAMKSEEAKRREAEMKLEELQQNVAEAKANRDRAEKKLKEEVEKARQKKAALIQRKREEYDEKLKEAKKQEAENRQKLEDLQNRQRTKYGTDFLKKVNLAKGAWYEKQAAERASWEGVQWVYQQKCDASIWTVAYWAARLEAAKSAHEIVKATTAAYLEAANGLDATANSDAFKTLVKGIEEAQKGLERASEGIDNLLAGGGFDGFVRAFVDDEEASIQAKIENLNAMLNDNNELQKEIRKAQEILDRDKPELEKEIAEADEAIARLKEDSELAKLERDYRHQLKIHNEVHNIIEGMQAGLETLKENWKAGIHELEKVVNEIQKAIASVIHIERIEVAAHTHALADNKPLKFVFIGTLGGKSFEIDTKWSPGKSLQGLYKEVTNEILKLA